jgi:hypothetical protein
VFFLWLTPIEGVSIISWQKIKKPTFGLQLNLLEMSVQKEKGSSCIAAPLNKGLERPWGMKIKRSSE